MTVRNLRKSGVLAFVVVTITVICWELYLRHNGATITYDDDSELWADKRQQVYKSPDKATVFIGSSRMKYDLDIPTWEHTTGKQAIQLAMEGSSPLEVMEDLANDNDFKGNLIVDATELLFFALDPMFNATPRKNLDYYHKQTPAQKVSFQLNHLLESQFVFLNKDFFSLNAELDKLGFANRENVYVKPSFPMAFSNRTFDRQTLMEPEFEKDTSEQRQVQNVWMFFLNKISTAPPPKVNPVPIILDRAKAAVDKIRKRGGDVVFIRPPSSGPYLDIEQHVFIRDVFWNGILTTTNSKGYHYADNPATNHFNCIEWSHLTPAQAKVYTQALINELPSSFVN